jgi:hypothetical protein
MYRSAPLYGELGHRARPRRPHRRPTIVRIVVSRADPRFASAVVQFRDARGRRRGSVAAMVFKLERIQGKVRVKTFGASVIAGPATAFARACTGATPSGIRTLVCPDPWRVLNYPRPRVRAQTAYPQRIASSDLHTLDWRRVALPGGVCGSSRPIRPHGFGYGPEAFIHADVDLLWWNPVWVYSWMRPAFGDLDGDGRDEAALQVVCANGGGTAGGQLAFSEVIFTSVGKSLRALGILGPQQPPLHLNATHVPLSFVAAIKRGKVVVSEAWYGRYDGDCCASGRARTVWTYDRGRLRPRTTILQKPWSSPLLIADVLSEPAARELDDERLSRIVATPDLRFAALITDVGQVIKRHVTVKLTIAQSPAPIVETRTIGRITPWQLNPARVVFGNLGQLQLHRKTTVTIEIEDPGTNPVRYPVIFTGG